MLSHCLLAVTCMSEHSGLHFVAGWGSKLVLEASKLLIWGQLPRPSGYTQTGQRWGAQQILGQLLKCLKLMCLFTNELGLSGAIRGLLRVFPTFSASKNARLCTTHRCAQETQH